MGVRVNEEYLEGLDESRILEAQRLVAETFEKMSDRQFLDWVKNRFPEASTGQVNVGVVVEHNTIHRFRYEDIRGVVEKEFDTRMGAPRIKPNMIVVTMPTEVLVGIDPVMAMKYFLKEFQEYANNGPAEPKLYYNEDMQPRLNKDWLDWYSEKYSVERTTAWKAGVARIAEELKKDLREWIAVPNEYDVCRVHFTRTIDNFKDV